VVELLYLVKTYGMSEQNEDSKKIDSVISEIQKMIDHWKSEQEKVKAAKERGVFYSPTHYKVDFQKYLDGLK
jgi:hypothetical protein